MQELSKDELCQVLVTPKNALSRQYSKQFDMSGAHLHITSKAMQAIAVIAKDKGTGARGLRSIMERLLMDAMYEVSVWDSLLNHTWHLHVTSKAMQVIAVTEKTRALVLERSAPSWSNCLWTPCKRAVSILSCAGLQCMRSVSGTHW